MLRRLLVLTALVASPLAARDALGVFEQWAAFRDAQTPRCYAVAIAAPSTLKRQFQPFATVAWWPRQQLRGQVHFRLSRKLAAGSPISLAIGGQRIALTGGGGDAWAAVVVSISGYVAIGGADGIGIKTLGSGERAVCVAGADDFMRDHANKDSYRKSRAWLHVPATEKQRAALRLGPADEPALTKYRAMCFLTFLSCQHAIRARVEAA